MHDKAFLADQDAYFFESTAPNKVVIVAYRGTTTNLTSVVEVIDDWVTDAEFKKVDLVVAGRQYGRVHKGFLHTRQLIRDQIDQQIMMYYNAGYHIVFAGHSLGGAVATLVAFEGVVGYAFDVRRLALMTVGSPRVGDATFADYFDQIGIVSRRFVNVVPRTGEWHPRH